MQRVACPQCSTTVLAEKYSEKHTSVQWLDDASTACPVIRSAETDGQEIGAVCPILYDSIDRAVRDGRIPFSQRSEPTPGVLG